MAKYLLDRLHVDPNKELVENVTAIAATVFNNDIPMAEMLVKYGAHAEPTGENGEISPISRALREKENEILKILLKTKPNLEYMFDEPPFTYLSQAMCAQNDEAVKILIEAGANVNNKEGRLPLRWAIATKKMELVTMLIEAGADVNAEDDGGSLMDLAEKLEAEEILETLIKSGAKRKAPKGQAVRI